MGSPKSEQIFWFFCNFACFSGGALNGRACLEDVHPTVSNPRFFRGVASECALGPVICFKKLWISNVFRALPEGRRRAEEGPPGGIPRGAVGARDPSRGIPAQSFGISKVACNISAVRM